MKKLVFASLLALGTSSLLASCGLLPPIDLGPDPLQIQGKQLTSSTLSLTGSGGLSTRTPGTGTASASGTFADIDPAKFTLTPSSIQLNLELVSGSVSNACAAAVNQTSISVTLSNLTLSLKDDVGADHNLSITVPAITFSINTTTGVISGLNLAALAFNIGGTNINTAKSILTTAPNLNTASVTTDIATTPALPGCTISVTLGASRGNAKF
jgi:hypothetical protein